MIRSEGEHSEQISMMFLPSLSLSLSGHLQHQRWENHIPLIRSHKQHAVRGSDEAMAARGTYKTGLLWGKVTAVISDMSDGLNFWGF